jgi:flagellin-specific chaperone FliS
MGIIELIKQALIAWNGAMAMFQKLMEEQHKAQVERNAQEAQNIRVALSKSTSAEEKDDLAKRLSNLTGLIK